jgi:hypothetical protein
MTILNKALANSRPLSAEDLKKVAGGAQSGSTTSMVTNETNGTITSSGNAPDDQVLDMGG